MAGIFGNGEIGIEHYPGSETKYKEQGRQPLYMLFREIIDLSMLERMNKRGYRNRMFSLTGGGVGGGGGGEN